MIFDSLYRRLFCRGGYGVHSPFVFDLITHVIEQKKHYYCYNTLNAVRKLLQRELAANSKRPRISERESCFLFRLANRFQPKTIFIAGSGDGLTALYLTAYAADTHCIVFEPEVAIADMSRKYANRYAHGTVAYGDDLIGLLKTMKSFDMFVWDAVNMGEDISLRMFDLFMTRLHRDSVMIIIGIRASTANRAAWTAICASPKASVTIDLGRLGIVFFNPALHRRIYQASIT